jgi:hypothetical protein
MEKVHGVGDVPGQEFRDAVDRMISKASQNAPEISFRIRSVQFG